VAVAEGVGVGPDVALAVGTLNDLLWSIKPKEDTEERKKLAALLPELLRRVKAYLDRVEVDQEVRTPFMNALGEVHLALIKGGRRSSKSRSRSSESAADAPAAAVQPAAPLAPAAAAPGPPMISSEDIPPTVVVTRMVQSDGVDIESITLAGKVLNSRPVRASEISNVERGDWVEFVQEGDTLLRARLSWVSPQRGIMVFTNPQSSQAISITPEALALQMKLGRAKKLDDSVAVVDRALGKALEAWAA
jgi:hypothetical protein